MKDVELAVKHRLEELKARGWTTQAVADTLGVAWPTLHGWLGARATLQHPRLTLMALQHQLFDARPPKMRRYGPANQAAPVPGTQAAQRLAELRAAGWTVQALADVLEVNRETVYRWLRRSPDYPMLLLALQHRRFKSQPPPHRRYPEHRAARRPPAAAAEPAAD